MLMHKIYTEPGKYYIVNKVNTKRWMLSQLLNSVRAISNSREKVSFYSCYWHQNNSKRNLKLNVN